MTLGENLDSDQVAFIVVNLERVWATLAVAPKDLPKLAVGDQVELRADAAPDRTFHARLTSVGSTTDETTRTVPVTVAIDHPEAILAAGSYVQATVLTEVHHDRLTVPTSALQEHTGRPTIYVASPEQVGRFEVRHVPALCAYFLSEDSERENPFLEKLRLHYRKALHRAIPNRATVLGVARLGPFCWPVLPFLTWGPSFCPSWMKAPSHQSGLSSRHLGGDCHRASHPG